MPVDVPESLLRQISPSQVRWYAVQAGWKPVKSVKRPIVVLNHPTDDLAQIQIPTGGSEKDRAFLMGEAIRQLAAFENRSSREVLGDLVVSPADVLRLQLQSREAELGTLPLHEGLHLLEGGRNLLLAAACSAHQPQPYFRSQSFGPAQEFLRSCRLGQTERGSYVATIIAPVTPALSPSPSLYDAVDEELDVQTEPYENRVTLLLMQSLHALRGIMDRGQSDEILRSVPQGVSANLCDALASMGPSDLQASLDISISWSRNRLRVPRRLPNRVAFAQGEFSVFREAGRRLKTGEYLRGDFIGPIIALQAEPAELYDVFHGSVTIRSLVEGRSARVRFLLKEPDYQRACDAHRDRHRVTISGSLQQDAQSRVFNVIRPQGFQISTDGSTAPEEAERSTPRS